MRARDLQDERESAGAADDEAQVPQVSDELFRLLVDGVRDYAIFALDPRGNIMTWNRGAQRLKGYSAAEIVGQHFSIFYPDADIARGKPGEELRLAQKSGRFEDEGWRLRKDGSLFYANIVITAMREPATGALIGFSKVTRDLTERRRSEEALRQAYRDMESFSYSASHDLRAPLRAVLSLAELTLEEPAAPLDPDVRANLEAIAKSAAQCTHLVEDFLRFAKASRQDLVRHDIDLNDVAQEVAAEVRLRYPHSVDFSTPAAAAIAHGDEPLIRAVLENLLDNAWKYTQRSAAPQVEFGVVADPRKEGMRVFYVRDNGAGFAAERAAELFEPFRRLHSPEEYAGSGIGLATVRRVIERHGGRVWAEGAPRQGATVYFALPE